MVHLSFRDLYLTLFVLSFGNKAPHLEILQQGLESSQGYLQSSGKPIFDIFGLLDIVLIVLN